MKPITADFLAYGRQHTYTIPGPVATGIGQLARYNDDGHDWTITSVRLTLLTAASVGDTTIDVKKNGTSIFATSGDRPTVTAGSTTAKATTIGTPAVADGDNLTIDVDAAGTGADTVMVTITYL